MEFYVFKSMKTHQTLPKLEQFSHYFTLEIFVFFFTCLKWALSEKGDVTYFHAPIRV